MKRRISSLVLVLMLAFSQTGCGSAQAWYVKLQKDPVAALQDGVSVMRVAMQAAQIAFDIWAGVSDPAVAANARLQFGPLMGNVNAGIAVAQDGLHIAAHLQQPNPDIDLLFGDARTSMTDLNVFIGGLSGHPGRAASPEVLRAVVLTEQASHYHVGRAL